MKTFFWHDYETSGINPATDRPLQFAGIRTNESLEIIADPINIYCKIPSDHLPHPKATIITGITPQYANKNGFIEPEFISKIYREMKQPETCSVGYNNIRFDDEVTRHTLYRNFYPPYEREYKNDNSRWDLIDLVRATAALRPNGINWPIYTDGEQAGNLCLKLEELAKANGFENKQAHNALADVYATIELAKLIRKAQPRIFDYYFDIRPKKKILSLLDEHETLVHVSGMYGAKRKFTSIITKLGQHPINTNEIIVIDLTIDPQPLFELSIDEIRTILFTKKEDLPENTAQLGIRTIRVNNCPFIAKTKVLEEVPENHLTINIDEVQKNLEKVKQHPNLYDKLRELYQPYQNQSNDVDQNLYSGDFFDSHDYKEIAKVLTTDPQQLENNPPQFKDQRLPELLFRFLARNFSEVLSAENQQRWYKCRASRLFSTLKKDNILGFEDFWLAWHEQWDESEESRKKQELLLNLKEYVEELQNQVESQNLV